MWNTNKYPFLTITTLSIGNFFLCINSNISLIDLGSKPCDFGKLVLHSIVGQYCVPKAGAERKKPKNMINFDLASISNDPLLKNKQKT